MIVRGDARAIPLRDKSVQCVVTSPPYWGLRDYGTGRWEGGDAVCEHQAPYEAGASANKGNSTTPPGRFVECKCGARRIDRQIGLEKTPDCGKRGMLRLRGDLNDGDRTMALRGILLGMWGTSDGARASKRPMRSMLSEAIQSDVLRESREARESQSQVGCIPCDPQDYQECEDTGAEPLVEDGSDNGSRGQMPLLRRDGADIPDLGPHQGRRQERVFASRRDVTDISTSEARGVSADKISSALLELQRGVGPVRAMSAFVIDRASVPATHEALFESAECGECYVCTIVEVFREIKRVLRDDGTVWLNLGDSYAHNGACGGGSPVDVRTYGDRPTRESDRSIGRLDTAKIKSVVPTGLKPKDLCGMPWRVAFALQGDGWYLRSDIVWAKPNPMPESVTDRPTRSHEYLFLLSKRERYFYDADAIREDFADERMGNPGAYSRTTNAAKGANNDRADLGFLNGGGGWNAPKSHHGSLFTNGKTAHHGNVGQGPRYDHVGRNKRDVWTVNSEATPEAHFATFPQKLIEPCILAGTSEKGCCAECGAPRVRVTDVSYQVQSPIGPNDKARSPSQGNNFATRALGRATKQVETTGWQPSCAHDAPSVPCRVFDPFLGSGTVGKVCERLGRRWVGLELSEQYIGIAQRRTAQRGLFV